jgi:Lysyl oxidase
MRWLGWVIGLALICAVAAGGGAAAGQGAGPEAVQLLPDLDQQTPNALTIARNTGRWPQYSLGFQSAVRNVGGGPLIITGRRASTRTPTMHAQQLIQRSDGTQDVFRTPDRLRYAISPTHQHWHLLRFDRYMLRRAGERKVLVRDQKTGFCLGDRYQVVSVAVPAAPPAPRYTGGCALRQPKRLSVTEGISPGYGDNYLPNLEGQSLLLSGLPAGRYVLIHRANADHALREVSYANNSASLLIDLRWRAGVPSVDVLASCPDTDRCDKEPPPPLAKAPALPAHQSGADAPPKNCVVAEEDRVVAAGDSSEEKPPKFSRAFYKRTLSIDASADGLDGHNLPISIEQVCRVPRALAKQASQLAGGDGIAIVYSSTSVWQDGTRLQGDAATDAIAGADTVTLKGRLANPKHWRTDDDGANVPTFKASRIDVTD